MTRGLNVNAQTVMEKFQEKVANFVQYQTANSVKMPPSTCAQSVMIIS